MSSSETSSSPLVGIFDIQKSYLNSLSTNVAVNGSTAGMVTDLETQLKTMHSNYNAASQNVNEVLTKQKEMQAMVDNEHTRLLEKKSIVDDTFNGKLRGSQLNESYRQKRAAYMKILIAISISLIVYLIVYFVLKTFSLPEGIGNLLSILLFSVTILYILSVMTEIYKRDNMDYSTLNLPAPKIVTDASAGQLSDAVSDKKGANPNECIGGSCCDTSISVWNKYANKCIDKNIKCGADEYYNITSNICVKSDDCTKNDGAICGKSCIPKSQSCNEPFSNLGSIIQPFNADLPKFAFV